jgi:hypothetical protein
MTDPFSVVAGVVGIVGVALSNTRQVYDFIVGIKGAPETVTTLSGDLDSLANILQHLSDLTQDPSQALFIVPLKGSLERCITALNQLEFSIKPYVEGLQNGRSKWKRFAWNFKEKEVAALQIRLGSCRENLQLAILLGVMTQQASGSKDIRANFQKLQLAADGDGWSVAGCHEPQSEAVDSDYGYALKRFLLEHESDLGSQLGDDPVSEETTNETTAVQSSGGLVPGQETNPDIALELLEVDEPNTQQKDSHVTANQAAPTCRTVSELRARDGNERADKWLKAMQDAEIALQAFRSGAKKARLPETSPEKITQPALFCLAIKLDSLRSILQWETVEHLPLPAEWVERHNRFAGDAKSVLDEKYLERLEQRAKEEVARIICRKRLESMNSKLQQLDNIAPK